MRRFKAIVTVMAVMAMLVVSSAAPAMAKGNGAVNEERNETPRQQANEENHFNNFNGFNRFGCFNFCGFENENTFSPFFTSFDNGFGDDNGFERQNVDINCPVVGVIADNGSAVNNTCNPLVASDL